MLDAVRYWLALITIMTLPWAIVYWYLIHPFIDFWRRLGAPATYTSVGAVGVGMAALAWHWRASIMATEYGTGPVLWLLALIPYVTAAVIERRCRRHLKFRMLVGVPELVPHPDGGTLLDDGIYARVRHPRYVAVTLGMLGVSFFCNYLAMWVAMAILVPGLYGVVLLEERELRRRFGQAYVEYSRRVPRFIPRSSH